MEPLKSELKQILARVKRLEARVVQDRELCQIVRDCSLRVALKLNHQNQMRLL